MVSSNVKYIAYVILIVLFWAARWTTIVEQQRQADGSTRQSLNSQLSLSRFEWRWRFELNQLYYIWIQFKFSALNNCIVMFYLIGIGLYDEKDITIKGLEIIRRADRVYLEHYTSVLCKSKDELVVIRSVRLFIPNTCAKCRKLSVSFLGHRKISTENH